MIRRKIEGRGNLLLLFYSDKREQKLEEKKAGESL